MFHSILPLAQEIATLRKEAQAFNTVRTALRSTSPDTNRNAANLAFQKVCFSGVTIYILNV